MNKQKRKKRIKLLQEIKKWLEDYEADDEHDNHFSVLLKDDAYMLLGEIKKHLEN